MTLFLCENKVFYTQAFLYAVYNETASTLAEDLFHCILR
jgi:hypothetical protein